jgi:hypothetical protein
MCRTCDRELCETCGVVWAQHGTARHSGSSKCVCCSLCDSSL